MGFGGAVNLGWFGTGLNIQGGFGAAIDSSGNIAPYSYGGGGGYLGTPGFSGGVQASVSDAKTICDLKGPFVNQSITVGVGPQMSVDGFQSSTSSNPDIKGYGVTVGGGFEAGYTYGETYTGLGSVGHLW